MIDWKMMSAKSPNLENLRLDPMRSTTESFSDCFVSCGQSLKSLTIDTASLAASGWYHSDDELANFVIPYFRSKPLLNLQVMEVTVKFLDEVSLFSFLAKSKYAKCLKSIVINAQSFNGNLKNEDLRKCIAQFMGSQQFEFRLSIKSQFYASERVISVLRLSENDGFRIVIDRERWKRKKKSKMKQSSSCSNNEIQQSLENLY